MAQHIRQNNSDNVKIFNDFQNLMSRWTRNVHINIGKCSVNSYLKLKKTIDKKPTNNMQLVYGPSLLTGLAAIQELEDVGRVTNRNSVFCFFLQWRHQKRLS